jgi:hypothetical protein
LPTKNFSFDCAPLKVRRIKPKKQYSKPDAANQEELISTDLRSQIAGFSGKTADYACFS